MIQRARCQALCQSSVPSGRVQPSHVQSLHRTRPCSDGAFVAAHTTVDDTQWSDGHRGVSRRCGRKSCIRRVCTCGFVTGIGWMDLVLLQTRLLMIHIGQMAIGVAVVGAAAQVASATCALQTGSLCGGSSIGFSTRVLSRAPFAPAVGAAAVAASWQQRRLALALCRAVRQRTTGAVARKSCDQLCVASRIIAWAHSLTTLNKPLTTLNNALTMP